MGPGARGVISVAGGLLTVIGLASLPDDLVKWAHWLGVLEGNVIRSILVTIGVVIFLWSRGIPEQWFGLRKILVRPSSPLNQATEKNVEWVHFEAEPTARLREVRNAEPYFIIGGREYRLKWQTQGRAREEQTLEHGAPCGIPVLLRSREDGYLGRRRIVKGVCYITDANFFDLKGFSTLSPNEEYHARLVVRYGEGRGNEAEFDLVIPDTEIDRIRIRRYRQVY